MPPTGHTDEEQRRYVRLPLSLPVCFPGGAGVSIDVSARGVYFETASVRSLDLGNVLSLSIDVSRVPDAAFLREVYGAARVVRVGLPQSAYTDICSCQQQNSQTATRGVAMEFIEPLKHVM